MPSEMAERIVANLRRDAENSRGGLAYLSSAADFIAALLAENGALREGWAALKDPTTLHVAMLRGQVAIPTWRSMVDLLGEVPNGEDVQLARIAELQEKLRAAEADRDALRRDAAATFPMLDGPRIPEWLARIVFAGYHAMHRGQDFDTIRRRGGFGWEEVPIFYKDPRGRKAIDAALHGHEQEGRDDGHV